MNKTELISQISESASMTKQEARAALDAVIKAISDALVSGETITIPASKVPAFKAGKALKDAVK